MKTKSEMNEWMNVDFYKLLWKQSPKWMNEWMCLIEQMKLVQDFFLEFFFNKWKIIHAKQKLMVFEKWYKKRKW